MFSIRRQLTTIGRSLDNDVVIPEPEVSRYHARIEYVNGHLEIVDLESTNGTIVNGTQVRRRAIEQGDSVVVGNAKLELLPYRGAVPQGAQGRPR
jgi:pSer/pThr/pTyr-binding forkhead associated (FHA) protein